MADSHCIHAHYKVRCIKFWLKILKLDSSRLPRASYDVLYSFDNVGRKNWATEIKHMFYSYVFGEVWVNQSVGDVNMFLYLFIRCRKSGVALKFTKLSATNKNVHMFIHIMKSSDEETIRQTAS